MNTKKRKVRLRVYDEYHIPVIDLRGSIAEVNKEWNKLKKKKLD